jgi:hypothetical protein
MSAASQAQVQHHLLCDAQTVVAMAAGALLWSPAVAVALSHAMSDASSRCPPDVCVTAPQSTSYQ